MLYPRLIPSLLINSKKELVKTKVFKNQHYIGDPLNKHIFLVDSMLMNYLS